MELLFVAVGGLILGIAARYLLPGRERHGVVVVPAIGAVAAAVVWVAATWLGLPWDGGWIWVIALACAALSATAAAVLLGRSRERADHRFFEVAAGRRVV